VGGWCVGWGQPKKNHRPLPTMLRTMPNVLMILGSVGHMPLSLATVG